MDHLLMRLELRILAVDHNTNKILREAGIKVAEVLDTFWTDSDLLLKEIRRRHNIPVSDVVEGGAE